MNPLMQISEVSVKVCFVGSPSQSIYTRGGIALEREERYSERSTLTWWRSAVNFSFPLCLAACRTRSSACDTRSRPCVRCMLCWLAFPAAPALGSADSAAGCPALFVGFTATYGGVRLLPIVHHRLRLLASPMRTSAARVHSLLVDREISRFPYKERPHMPSSPTTPGRTGTRVGVPVRVAFRNSLKASAPGMRSFSRLNSLAYTLPCQRFADTLADAGA